MAKNKFKTLGELEAKIMDFIWQKKQACVRNVLANFKGAKKPAYTTIMTVMNRLCDKGILKRQLKGESYIYYPTKTREEFLSSSSKQIINSLIKEFGSEVAVAGFIDAIDKDSLKGSKELKEKLKKIIK